MNFYQKEDVIPYMRGMWRDALKSICGLDDSCFSGKHGPCPNCGGSDRFRWTDKVHERGDGGAYCNNCGANDGIGWLQKLTEQPFSECVNILGRFLGKQPQEYVVKKNKQASSTPGYNFGSHADQEKCLAVMERVEFRSVTPLTLFEGLGGESYSVGVKMADDGRERITHVEPCYLVNSDGLLDDPSNILFINADTGEESFYAKRMTYGAVTRTNQTDKAIYLCTNWIDSQHVALATGQEVWNCFNPSNLEIVAHRYNGEREMRVACLPGDKETLIMADDAGLQVVMPNGYGFKSGVRRKLYDPASLLTI